jgi:hypothetical protein
MTAHSSGTASVLQQRRYFGRQAVGSTVRAMRNSTRQAKVTPETRAESKRLEEIWKAEPRPTQADFGEEFEIGNQSAVGQFLRGDTPLSLKAARGFAKGLGVRIEDFSPRLAAEAAALAGVIPASELSADVAELALKVDQLRDPRRQWVLDHIRDTIEFALREMDDGPEGEQKAA